MRTVHCITCSSNCRHCLWVMCFRASVLNTLWLLCTYQLRVQLFIEHGFILHKSNPLGKTTGGDGLLKEQIQVHFSSLLGIISVHTQCTSMAGTIWYGLYILQVFSKHVDFHVTRQERWSLSTPTYINVFLLKWAGCNHCGHTVATKTANKRTFSIGFKGNVKSCF